MAKKQKGALVELAVVSCGTGFQVIYDNEATGTHWEPYFATREEAEEVFNHIHGIFSRAVGPANTYQMEGEDLERYEKRLN